MNYNTMPKFDGRLWLKWIKSDDDQFSGFVATGFNTSAEDLKNMENLGVNINIGIGNIYTFNCNRNDLKSLHDMDCVNSIYGSTNLKLV
jgi:hypothetical protein